MSARNLRLVHVASAPASPPRPPPLSLQSISELEPLLRRMLRETLDGELHVQGQGSARICMYEGRVAWVRLRDYPEHLGDVMRRELGLSAVALSRGMAHCRETGQRFVEGMVGLGLVRPAELRRCLYRHISDLLAELMTWQGPATAHHSQWPHRYDPAYLFELDQLLVRPGLPSRSQLEVLTQRLRPCVERLSNIRLACVIEEEEGTLLYSAFEDHRAMLDLLGLCTAEVQHLAMNRLIRADGSPRTMVMSMTEHHVVVQRFVRPEDWLLVLGGSDSPGRMISLAREASEALPSARGEGG